MVFIEMFIFSAALSLDLFAFSLGYGLAKVKIKGSCTAAITAICAAVLLAGLVMRGIIAPHLPDMVLSALSFAVLITIGLYKIFQKQEDSSADKTINLTESIAVGLSASVDGFAGGLASNFPPDLFTELLLMFSALSVLAVWGGNILGNFSANELKLDLCKMSGIALVFVAIVRLFS